MSLVGEAGCLLGLPLKGEYSEASATQSFSPVLCTYSAVSPEGQELSHRQVEPGFWTLPLVLPPLRGSFQVPALRDSCLSLPLFLLLPRSIWAKGSQPWDPTQRWGDSAETLPSSAAAKRPFPVSSPENPPLAVFVPLFPVAGHNLLSSQPGCWLRTGLVVPSAPGAFRPAGNRCTSLASRAPA